MQRSDRCDSQSNSLCMQQESVQETRQQEYLSPRSSHQTPQAKQPSVRVQNFFRTSKIMSVRFSRALRRQPRREQQQQRQQVPRPPLQQEPQYLQLRKETQSSMPSSIRRLA